MASLHVDGTLRLSKPNSVEDSIIHIVQGASVRLAKVRIMFVANLSRSTHLLKSDIFKNACTILLPKHQTQKLRTGLLYANDAR